MSKIRSGHTSGEEGFLVFDNGTLLEYPRFSKASNGFVRGPKGEKIGRGDQAVAKAEQMSLNVINNWIDQFQKHGYKFLGVTAPMALKMRHSRMTARDRIDWFTGSPPDNMTIAAKAYWQNSPDTWDLIEVNVSISRYRGGSSLQIRRVTPMYRPSKASPEGKHMGIDGRASQYADNSEEQHEVLGRHTGTPRDIIQALQTELDNLEAMIRSDYVKVEWSHDLTQLRETIDKYLDARDVVAKLQPLLEELAGLYGHLGEYVTLEHVTTADGDEPVLRIEGTEHTIWLHPKSIRHTCHYERDEMRLAELKKQRLEQELLDLHHEFGDIRHDEE